jgi:hypothetical protein
MSLARQSTVWEFRERFEATKWFTSVSSVWGLSRSRWRGGREPALLVEDAGDRGDAMAAVEWAGSKHTDTDDVRRRRRL